MKKRRRRKEKSVSFGGGGKQQLLLLAGGREGKLVNRPSGVALFWCSSSSLFHCQSFRVTDDQNHPKEKKEKKETDIHEYQQKKEREGQINF